MSLSNEEKKLIAVLVFYELAERFGPSESGWYIRIRVGLHVFDHWGNGIKRDPVYKKKSSAVSAGRRVAKKLNIKLVVLG